MPHFEVGFRLRHRCPFNDLSVKYPHVVLAWWTNFDQDVLEVTGWNPEDVRNYRLGLKASIREMGGHISRSATTQANWQLVVSWDRTKWEYSTSRTFVKNNCVLVQPTIYTKGWEWYRVIALSGDSLRRFFVDFDKKGRVEVISRRQVEAGSLRDNFVISTTSLFGGLTAKQAEALQAALDRGYYLLPKRISTGNLARSAGVTRTTFGEHLRKAESKIMQSLTQYMELSNTDGKKTLRRTPAATLAFLGRAAHPIETSRVLGLLRLDPLFYCCEAPGLPPRFTMVIQQLFLSRHR